MNFESNNLLVSIIFILIYGVRLIYQAYLLRHRKEAKEKGEWAELLLVVIPKNIFVVIAIFLLAKGVEKNFIFFLGWAIFLFGITVRLIALRQLGPMYSVNVELRENHELIRTGIYEYVRHPLYFAYIVDTLGMVIFLQSILYIPVLFLIAVGISKRVKNEEIALRKIFGEKYLAYENEVPGLNFFYSIYKKMKN